MYECHVTVQAPSCHGADRDFLEQLAEELRWKTSEIDGDPVMGDKVFFYFTAHAPSLDFLKAKMHRLEHNLLMADFPVLRSKIEHIVYDTKTGVGIE